MDNRLAKSLRLDAFKLITFQGIIAVLIALIIFLIWGVSAGLSALAGGFTCLLPNFVFATYSFRYAGARQAEQVLTSIKRGNTLKLLLTICLFTLVFKFFTIMAIPFFCCYILVIFLQWAAPIFFNY